jgi:hypothetical protein
MTAGFLEELAQPPMQIHSPLWRSPNLGGFDQSNLNFFT